MNNLRQFFSDHAITVTWLTFVAVALLLYLETMT